MSQRQSSLFAGKRLSFRAVMRAAEADDGSGFCVACGSQQSGCEPDMRRGRCESCGESKVYGAEELLLRTLRRSIFGGE